METSRIHKLDKNIAELIAAGEVVERPSSAVKELVENSIDSGANSITVEIRKGGISYIKVVDNGEGILKEDVKTAFLKNATSKISSKDDLFKISTLGFRGEALPSIAAVSQVTMITRHKSQEIGIRFLINGGEEKNISDYGAPVGTSFVIRNLFFNTPARIKFLKSDIAEGNAIANIMDRLALSHPGISFKLTRDNKVVLFTPGNNDLFSAIHAVYGKEVANSIIETRSEHNGVKIRGYVSKTEKSRGNRSLQIFYVNNRFVKTNTGQTALEEGYKNSIMKGKFPFCFLFIQLPWSQVDVNTHPAKIEVRFVNEKDVYQAVYYAAKSAITIEPRNAQSENYTQDFNYENQKLLQKNESMKSEAIEQLKIGNLNNIQIGNYDTNYTQIFGNKKTSVKNSDNKNAVNYEIKKEITLSQSGVEYARKNSDIPQPNRIDVKKEKLLREQAFDDLWNPVKKTRNIVDFQENNTKSSSENPKITPFDARILGEVFKTYILLQVNDSIYLVDKHAAHERIIFETLKKNKNTESQILLEPVAISMQKNNYSILIENMEKLKIAGIFIEDFGIGTILLREFPVVMEHGNMISIMEEISDNLLNNKKDITPEFVNEIYNSIACKSAIKGNDITSEDEIIELINILMENNEIKHCPHGRPIIIEIEKKEIEKRFGR